MIDEEAIVMGAANKSPYTPFKLNGTSIPPAKSGLKVMDGEKLAAQAASKQALRELAASKGN